MQRSLASLALLVSIGATWILGCADGTLNRYHVDFGSPNPSWSSTMPIVFKAALSPVLSELDIDSAASYVHAFESNRDLALADGRKGASDLEIARGIRSQFLREKLRFAPLSEVVAGEHVSVHEKSEMPALVWAIKLEHDESQRPQPCMYFRVDCTNGETRVSYNVNITAEQDRDEWRVMSIHRIQESVETRPF